MSTIKEGQYVIKSVEYKTQAMTNYPDGKGSSQSSAILFRHRRIHITVLFSRWGQICRRRSADRTSLELLVTRLGFSQPMQWNVKGNDQYGYTFENYAFHKFLDSLDNTVNATDKHTIWDIVGDDQKGYKFV